MDPILKALKGWLIRLLGGPRSGTKVTVTLPHVTVSLASLAHGVTWVEYHSVLMAVLAWALWQAAAFVGARRKAPLSRSAISADDLGAGRTPLLTVHALGVRGRPDVLERLSDGTVVITEIKSRGGSSPRHGHVLQLMAYMMAVEEQGSPVRGVLKYPTQAYAYTLTPEWRHAVAEAVQHIREAKMGVGDTAEAHPSPGLCRDCPVKASCPDAAQSRDGVLYVSQDLFRRST